MQRIYIVSHTHWDREWYAPFQVFRARLIKCIDQLLDIFASDPDYKYFLLDGQTIVLEDYLEVRPASAQVLQQLITEVRLQIGPWYVLPDEFLVSGESIIRNLMRGICTAHEFGSVMPVGYIPDPFGHISQMPQILRGFALGVAALRRGLADEPTELWWQSPDGTRVLLCYLRDSYDNAAWLPRDSAGFIDGVKRLCGSLAPYAVTENFLLMNGTDHMEPWRELSTLMHAAREQIDDAEIVHASLPMYTQQVEKDIADKQLTLQVAHGELRNPKRHHLLPGVTSTRMWIKQRNAHSQMLLEKWAEPFSAFATSDFQSPISNLRLVNTAWKYLLQNHPHDSICGCGIDQTHDEMRIRFDWAEQIAEPMIATSLAAIARKINVPAHNDRIPMVVFNPTQNMRTDIVQATLELPGDPENFVLLDEFAKPIPFQVTGAGRLGNHFNCEFVAPNVPSLGYRTFMLAKGKMVWENSLHRTAIENDFFLIEPDKNTGTLMIIDKITGAILRGLNQFVDGGDRGDLYNYCPPTSDAWVDAPAQAPRITIDSGAVRQSLHIEMLYRLPGELSQDRNKRAQYFVDERIITTVSVYPGVRRIDFCTEVDNRARDHRLRVEFPTHIVTAYANVGQAFDVVARSLELPRNTTDWIEQPRPEAPMQDFVSIADEKTGLTLVTRGLPEYEARPETHGTTLALTLLRCVGWLSRNDLATRSGDAGPQMQTPGAQEIGPHVFEYALVPHTGNFRNALAQVRAFCAPMRVIAPIEKTERNLPPAMSFAEASPDEFIITAIKASEDGTGIVVRGYNIDEETIVARIRVWKKFSRAMRTNLNEAEITSIALQDGYQIALPVRSKEIVTIKFQS